MHVEFKPAVAQDEIRKLRAFDRKVFPESDVFGCDQWAHYDTFWMMVEGKAVGCCAFLPHVDFQEDIRAARDNPPMRGSLYISTTGILPVYQGLGLGSLLKAWQIAYARRHGFERIVTNNRKRNRPIIRLNEKFGFQIIRTTPRYYSEPTDATVGMELQLKPVRPR